MRLIKSDTPLSFRDVYDMPINELVAVCDALRGDENDGAVIVHNI